MALSEREQSELTDKLRNNLTTKLGGYYGSFTEYRSIEEKIDKLISMNVHLLVILVDKGILTEEQVEWIT